MSLGIIMPSVLKLVKLLILDLELSKKDRRDCYPVDYKCAWQIQKKWLFAMLSYFRFTTVFCCKHHGFWKIWSLQKVIRGCLFTVSFNSRTNSCKTKLSRVGLKTNGRKWFFTLHELWNSLTQHVVKGKSTHGCKIMGIYKNKYGIWSVCGIDNS